MKDKFKDAWEEMLSKISGWMDELIINLPNLVIAILVFIICYLLSTYISKLLRKVLQKSSLQTSMVNLIAKLSSVAVILLGLFLVLWILNLSQALKAVLAGAGVAGLAVGLALQGALTNTYSGIVISAVKHIKFGDWIAVKDLEGEVVNIDLRAITLKQLDNNMVYIPNKIVVENPIKNYSTTAQSRVILECGVAYNSDLRQVLNIVKETLIKHFDEMEHEEDIIFLFTEFSSSSIDFEVRFRIDSTSALEVARARSKAMIFIKEAFDQEGITIPFPIRTLDLPEPALEAIDRVQ